jgi:hypothetical protein
MWPKAKRSVATETASQIAAVARESGAQAVRVLTVAVHSVKAVEVKLYHQIRTQPISSPPPPIQPHPIRPISFHVVSPRQATLHDFILHRLSCSSISPRG